MQNAFDADGDMPVGLKMALSQNLNVLNRFSSLPRDRQRSFIDGARKISSKQEMEAYTQTLMQG